MMFLRVTCCGRHNPEMTPVAHSLSPSSCQVSVSCVCVLYERYLGYDSCHFHDYVTLYGQSKRIWRVKSRSLISLKEGLGLLWDQMLHFLLALEKWATVSTTAARKWILPVISAWERILSFRLECSLNQHLNHCGGRF